MPPSIAPVHLQQVYRDGERLPVAERLSATGLSMRSAVSLTKTEIARAVDAVAVDAVASVGRAGAVVCAQ